MAGHLEPTSAPAGALAEAGPRAALSDAFRTALHVPDVRDARGMTADAAADGAAPGRLCVDVVRPALAELQHPARSARARLAAGTGEAILADLVGGLPVTERAGIGRAAVVSCRDSGIEAVDGSVATDFLEADGWHVARLGDEDPHVHVSALAHEGSIELAVAVAHDPQELVRGAAQRLPDPGVVADAAARRRLTAAGPLPAVRIVDSVDV